MHSIFRRCKGQIWPVVFIEMHDSIAVLVETRRGHLSTFLSSRGEYVPEEVHYVWRKETRVTHGALRMIDIDYVLIERQVSTVVRVEDVEKITRAAGAVADWNILMLFNLALFLTIFGLACGLPRCQLPS
jgi:predicted ATP-dependent Lon-type protease